MRVDHRDSLLPTGSWPLFLQGPQYATHELGVGRGLSTDKTLATAVDLEAGAHAGHVRFELCLGEIGRQPVKPDLAGVVDPQQVVIEIVLARGKQLSELIDRWLLVQIHHKAPYYPLVGRLIHGATVM